MPEKTFKQRVQEEFACFPNIYADFKKEIHEGNDLEENVWSRLFAIPLDSQPNDSEKRPLKARYRHDSVRNAVQALGANELRLGELVTKDFNVALLIEQGVLTPDDVVPPFPEFPNEWDKNAERAKPDHRDPFFWRALLEVFCRAFVAPRGRKPWPVIDMIDLAFDLNDIRRASEEPWNGDEALKTLRNDEPYKTRYPASNSAANSANVGEDRVQEITDLIGPIDDEALITLKKLFPDEFSMVVDNRLRRTKVHALREFAERLSLSSDNDETLFRQLLDLIGPVTAETTAKLKALFPDSFV